MRKAACCDVNPSICFAVAFLGHGEVVTFFVEHVFNVLEFSMLRHVGNVPHAIDSQARHARKNVVLLPTS